MIYGKNAKTFVDILTTQYAFVRFRGFFNQIHFKRKGRKGSELENVLEAPCRFLKYTYVFKLGFDRGGVTIGA